MSVDLKYTVAIGDIHGMADEFAFLLDYLEHRFSPTDTQFILLGDLIDRGPETPRTISMAINLLNHYPSSKAILGNHDAFFLEMLDGSISEYDMNQWAQQGGIETMQSYLSTAPIDIASIRNQILETSPDHHQFLKHAVPMVVSARHCFVHAGIDPTVPFASQNDKTVRWIRRGFLDHTEAMEKVVVHGHSITSSFLPEVHPNRIALDTGSYKSGRISAAIFDNDVLMEFVCAKSSVGQLLRFDEQMRPIYLQDD